jgi:hypothetical protein
MTEVLTPTELPSPFGNMSEDPMHQGEGGRQEEHMGRRWNGFQNGIKNPRRAQTLQVYKTPATPPAEPAVIKVESPAELNEEQPRSAEPASQPQQPKKPLLKPRPSLGPPRRSYSVTDKEPIPHHHRLSSKSNIVDLPGEVHYAIFDFLDPIDSTCLGLTNKHFYAIHRRMHGSVPLGTRRSGPNELEWAWHVAGAPPKSKDQQKAISITAAKAEDGAMTPQDAKELSRLRVRGQAYCRKCGVTRCELYKHLTGWMGDKMEYCTITERYGDVALPTAKSHCSRGLPSNPHRCARHFRRKNKVTLL